MANDWTHVRVRRETHERLVAEAKKLHGRTIEGRAGVSIYERLDIVSIDTVIRVLLQKVSAHRERSKRSKKKEGNGG